MKKRMFFTMIGIMIAGLLLISACSFTNASPTKSVTTTKSEVALKTIAIDTTTYYDEEVQTCIQQQIDEYKQQDYTLQQPLLLLNPYGTNTTGLYVYFTQEQAGHLQVRIETQGYAAFDRVYGTNSFVHEYQIIGLIAGAKNTVTFTYVNESNEVLESTSFTIEVPPLVSGFVNQIEKQTGTSTQSLPQELYVTLGLSAPYEGYSFLIDDQGSVRGELVLEEDMSENLLFYEDSMLLSVAANKMARINALGKVIAVYDLGQYKIHHDYQVNEDGIAVILVDDTEKNSVEDVIITLDLKSGEVRELVDFDNLMADYKEMTIPFPDDSTWGAYGADTWDWLHFNTLQLVGEDEMILSSRETSTIMKFSHIYEDITLEYFIGEKSIWEDTAYASYSFTKEGDFPDSAGQHTLTYVQSEELEEGQYYLYLFNNNFWCYESRDSEVLIPEASTDFSYGSASYYTCYLVDETTKTYSLIDRLAVPYSSIVSSVQWIDEEHLLVNSGTAKLFSVYDENKELIARYDYDIDGLTQGYRVFAYDFQGFWFS